jgi:AAA ATPase domain
MTLLHADDLLDDTTGGRPTPGRMFVGPVGSGKTATLCRIADDAVLRDWIVVAAAPDRGHPLSESLLLAASALVMELNELRPGAGAVRGLSFTVDRLAGLTDVTPDDLSRCMEAIGAAATDVRKNVLLVIDDVNYAAGNSEATLSAVIEASRQSCPVAVIGATLGGSVPDGWDIIPVGPLKRADVLTLGGEPIVPVVDRVIELTGGWALLVRMLVDEIRRQPSNVKLSNQVIDSLWPQVLQRAVGVKLERITPAERRYLLAISDLSDGQVSTSQVAKAMGDNGRFGESSVLVELRAALIGKELIWQPSRDVVDLAAVGMRAYLRTFR